jgi:hypothetical protein
MIIFVVAGFAICISLIAMMLFINILSNWGDGSGGSSRSIPDLLFIIILVPFIVYFVSSVLATLSTQRTKRVRLSWTAQTSLSIIGLFFVITLFSKEPLIFFVYPVFAIPLTYCWVILLRSKPKLINKSETIQNKIQ